jgi:hypothetical protein
LNFARHFLLYTGVLLGGSHLGSHPTVPATKNNRKNPQMSHQSPMNA